MRLFSHISIKSEGLEGLEAGMIHSIVLSCRPAIASVLSLSLS